MRRCALSGSLSEDHKFIDADIVHYLCSVLRLGHGDRFDGFDGQGQERMYRLNCEGDTVFAEGVGEPYKGRCGAPIALCFAIPKGDKLDGVARQLSELGVAELHLWSAERSIGVWKRQKVQHKLGRLERVAREASRQSGRADELMIHTPVRLEELIDRHQSVPLRFFLDPMADHGWPDSSLYLSSDEDRARDEVKRSQLLCVLLVGPEGGISPAEQVELKIAGWKGLRLVSPVLRTETAGVVACALALDRLGYLA